MDGPEGSSQSASLPAGTPRALGYRWPAEWEPHQATWLSWPHNRETWPGHFPAAVQAFARLVAVLARSEPLHINVNDAAMERAARTTLRTTFSPRAAGEIEFHRIVTNDAWCRDHAAIVLSRKRANVSHVAGQACPPLLALDWEYNAWGGKYPPFAADNAVAGRMGAALGLPCVRCPMVLEGGSVDGNGQGTVLTTESCLLHPNRNPQLSREQIEGNLRELLVVDQIVWLAAGIAGDDTDGHVDDFARFVAPHRVVLVIEEDPNDENYLPLRENLARLTAWHNERGRSLEIVPLPSPRALVADGQRFPASYANFYVANQVVVVPQFEDPLDRVARDTLAEIFPEREVVGIDCRDLIWGLGAIHCLTQQVPGQ